MSDSYFVVFHFNYYVIALLVFMAIGAYLIFRKS